MDLLLDLRARKPLRGADKGVGSASPAPVASLEGSSLGGGGCKPVLGIAARRARWAAARSGVDVIKQTTRKVSPLKVPDLGQPGCDDLDGGGGAQLVGILGDWGFGRKPEQKLWANAAEAVLHLGLNRGGQESRRWRRHHQ